MSKTISEQRVALSQQIHASALLLRPLILEARAAGNDGLADGLLRKFDELARLATRIFNEQWPGEIG